MLLENKQVTQRLQSRFEAQGTPVFLVRDERKGVSQGDFMRFADKAVLIDANVWHTLKQEGALSQIKKEGKVLNIRANSNSASWSAREKSVSDVTTKKAYLLGKELLKIFEEYFGKVPGKSNMVLRFEGKKMSLLVPKSLLDNLPIVRVERVDPKRRGVPQIVSVAPKQDVFLGDSLQWQIWAVDPNEPSSNLSYSYQGSLPKGITWDAGTHSLKGRFKKVGTYSFSLIAQNPNKKRDVLQVTLNVVPNEKPVIANIPSKEVLVGNSWNYTPYLSDLDHPAGDLDLEVIQKPRTMDFDSETNTFYWEPDASLSDKTTFIKLKVTDPLGASTVRTFPIKILSADKKNSPPLITGVLPNWEVEQGQKEVYIPVVVDPDNDSYKIEVTVSNPSLAQINGASIELSTEDIGIYSAEVLARDEHGAEARQRVVWKVVPRPSLSYSGLYLGRHGYSGFDNWDLGYQFKQSRIGLFLPSWGNLTEGRAFAKMRFPMAYVGANLMPSHLVDKGNYFFTDVGLTFRGLRKQVFTGGVFTRFDGRANITEGFIKSRVELEVKGYIQNGILILDTRDRIFGGIDTSDPLSLATVLEDTSLVREYNEDNSKSDNAVIYSRMEILYHVGYNFWVGPLMNRLDALVPERFEQRFGFGSRYELETRHVSGQQAFRFSWGEEGFLFDMRTKFSFRIR
jgi:hypothetical protein